MLNIYKGSILDAKKIKQVYKEAFPLKERKPFLTITKGIKKGHLELMCYKEYDQIVAFGTCFVKNDLVYLDYLAVDKRYRDKGYGSIYLEQLFQYYKDKRVCLIMERVDEPCQNKEQRIKRKAFYLKNGLKESGLFTSAKSGNYEILIHGGDLSGEEFIDIMEYSLGPVFTKLAKYHIVK